MRKYPKAVCTGKSAFYYHSLTDVIPGYYYLATKRTDTRIKDSRVKQSFIKNDIFDAGIIQNYRKISFEMDFGLVEDYAAMFRNGTKLMDMIQMEVL